MRLTIGDRLGRFEILGYLGAGGMGEVYRARDPQLLRDVAIKVLPAAVSRDRDRQRRFEKEARAAGSLNHPNIVAIHDVGVQDEVTWIVTELLDGETLRHRLDGRPLSPSLAVDYAIQIANGLAAAHDRGIVHRDVTPSNVFITRDERVKILDFGLAKLTGLDGGESTETITIGTGQAAAVVGTTLYMSPEQCRGHRLDHRSDIFSFGTVFYEMLAGFSPFRRATTAETFGAIINDDAPTLAVPGVSAGLERIVRHCLEKEPAARFQSARDLAFDLQTLSPAQTETPTATAPRRRAPRVIAVGTAGVLAIAMVAAIAYLAGRNAGTAPDSIADQSVHRVTDFAGLEEFPSISPDRKSVAFTASVDGRRQIFVRLLASGAPLQITFDPADHQLPRWSPDSSALLYFSPAEANEPQGAIWSVPALRGAPRRLLSAIGGADVNRAGRIACFSLVGGQIQLVTAALDGSGATPVARLSAGYHRYPRWSPDGRWIAFQRGDGVRDDIFVVSARGGEPRQLTFDRNVMSGLTWLPDSIGVIYASSRGSTVPYLPPQRLWEVRLDGAATRPLTSAEVSYEEPDLHDSGLMAASRLRMRFDLWRFPFEGNARDNVRVATAVTQQTGQVLTPTASPDGQQVAFLYDSGGHSNIWVVSARGGDLRQVTFEEDPAVSLGVPIWSPAGDAIAFVSSKGRTGLEFGVWLVNPDGSNLRQLIAPGLGMAWSEDGKSLYFADTAAGALKKVAASGGTPAIVRSEPVRNVIGAVGTTLYYMVEHQLTAGRPEFEIRAATPENGPSRLVERIPASRVPSWQIVNPSLSPDGQWLALPLTDGFTTNIWALSTTTGEWRQVTDFGSRAIFIARRVSWAPDGRSILAALGEGDSDVVLIDRLITRR